MSKRNGRQTWKYETITQQNLVACYERGLTKRLGKERALFYLMAVSIGLRFMPGPDDVIALQW
jgi:hypothetical protein